MTEQRTPTGGPSAVLRAALWVLALGGALLLARYALRPPQLTAFTYIDLQVYRDAVESWRSGASPYDGVYTANRLLFTYPPVALLLLAPLTWLPLPAAAALSLAVSIAALLLVVALSLRAVGARAGVLVALTLAVGGAASVLEPVWETLVLGQINLVLVALVLVDAQVVGPRWRGLLTGVAAAVKLTPLVVVLYFAWRRDWAAVRRMLASFAALMLLGAVIAPGDSWRYLTGLTGNADRVGDTADLINQSLRGMVTRVLGVSTASTAVWLLLCAGVLGLLAVALRHRPSDPAGPAGERELLGLALVAVAGLLASPVSWAHHWVWGAPLAIALLGSRRERWSLRWSGGLVVAVLLAWRWVWIDGRPLDDGGDPWLVLGVGSAYVAVGLLVLVLAALVRPLGPGDPGGIGVPSS